MLVPAQAGLASWRRRPACLAIKLLPALLCFACLQKIPGFQLHNYCRLVW